MGKYDFSIRVKLNQTIHVQGTNRHGILRVVISAKLLTYY